MLIRKSLVEKGILLEFKEDLGCSLLIKQMDINVIPTTVVAEVLLDENSSYANSLEYCSPYKKDNNLEFKFYMNLNFKEVFVDESNLKPEIGDEYLESPIIVNIEKNLRFIQKCLKDLDNNWDASNRSSIPKDIVSFNVDRKKYPNIPISTDLEIISMLNE